MNQGRIVLREIIVRLELPRLQFVRGVPPFGVFVVFGMFGLFDLRCFRCFSFDVLMCRRNTDAHILRYITDRMTLRFQLLSLFDSFGMFAH